MKVNQTLLILASIFGFGAFGQTQLLTAVDDSGTLESLRLVRGDRAVDVKAPKLKFSLEGWVSMENRFVFQVGLQSHSSMLPLHYMENRQLRLSVRNSESLEIDCDDYEVMQWDTDVPVVTCQAVFSSGRRLTRDSMEQALPRLVSGDISFDARPLLNVTREMDAKSLGIKVRIRKLWNDLLWQSRNDENRIEFDDKRVLMEGGRFFKNLNGKIEDDLCSRSQKYFVTDCDAYGHLSSSRKSNLQKNLANEIVKAGVLRQGNYFESFVFLRSQNEFEVGRHLSPVFVISERHLQQTEEEVEMNIQAKLLTSVVY